MTRRWLPQRQGCRTVLVFLAGVFCGVVLTLAVLLGPLLLLLIPSKGASPASSSIPELVEKLPSLELAAMESCLFQVRSSSAGMFPSPSTIRMQISGYFLPSDSGRAVLRAFGDWQLVHRDWFSEDVRATLPEIDFFLSSERFNESFDRGELYESCVVAVPADCEWLTVYFVAQDDDHPLPEIKGLPSIWDPRAASW